MIHSNGLGHKKWLNCICTVKEKNYDGDFNGVANTENIQTPEDRLKQESAKKGRSYEKKKTDFCGRIRISKVTSTSVEMDCATGVT